MVKTKIFKEKKYRVHSYTVEKEINTFLRSLPKKDFIDIKYNCNGDVIIIYESKEEGDLHYYSEDKLIEELLKRNVFVDVRNKDDIQLTLQREISNEDLVGIIRIMYDKYDGDVGVTDTFVNICADMYFNSKKYE